MQANASSENQAAYVKQTPHDLQDVYHNKHSVWQTVMLTEHRHPFNGLFPGKPG